jgi:hypothetical protein
MLSRQRPFPDVAAYHKKISKDFRPLTELVPGLPRDLDRVVERLLEPDPSRRYPSAAACAADIAAALPRA